MKLTDNFDSKEFFLTESSPQWLIDLAYMLALRLQTIRDRVGVPIHITSYYRSPFENKKLKYSAKGSLHTRGLAVDFTVDDKRLLHKIYNWLESWTNYGELFLYELPDGTFDSIHLALEAIGNENETLRYVKGSNGLIKKGN